MSDGAVAVTLPPLASPTREVWQVLLNLAGLPGVEWTLIGGQMVLLHALEHGVSPPQVSQDGDVVGNVRSNQKTIKRIVAFLEADGFTLDGISPEGIAHRYVKQWEPADVKFDVLAPEGLSEGTDLSTTGSGRTIRVPGGTQALDPTERVLVAHEGREGFVPRPTLLAAIVGKGAACGLGGDVSRHLRDLALLCCLVADPFSMVEDLGRTDRRRVRLGHGLRDDAHPAWALVSQELRRDGQLAYQILAADPQ